MSVLAPFANRVTSTPAKASQKAAGRGLPWERSTGFSAAEVTLVLRSLATLASSGVPLPKAIGALAEEPALAKRREQLRMLQRRIESGELFSNALGQVDEAFDRTTIARIRVGERSGKLPESLEQIADQRENASKIRETVGKKLAYPVVLTVIGSGVIAFLLGYVVPVFEETYAAAKAPLPGITKFMILVGDLTQQGWWIATIVLALGAVGFSQLMKHEPFRQWFDRSVLQIPVVGDWLAEIALLRLMETLGSLMESGFTLVESLEESVDAMSNHAVKSSVRSLLIAVQRGERFSREVERQSQLFPPMVSQLVIVGEQTGRLVEATRRIRSLLEERITRKTTVAVGVIEPVLTISLAAAIAVILLAIYLPMFDMVRAVG